MTETAEQYHVETTKLPKSEVEIKASIPWSEVERERSAVLKELGENVEIKGFRKGNAPEKVLADRVGGSRILTEMAERTLSRIYPQIIGDEKLQTIGRPKITITKLAQGNTLEFKARSALMPEMELPDYKNIAEKAVKEIGKEEVVVEKSEVDEAINHIRKQWAKNEKFAKGQEKAEKPEDVDSASISISDEDLPKLNNEFVKKLGDFENIEDFRARLKENLGKEKERKREESKRIAILEKIVEKSKGEMPEILVKGELDKMVAQFDADVTRAGVKMEEYLKSSGKSRDDIRSEWRSDAEKRAKTQLVLNKIAAVENIRPDEGEVKKEVEHMRVHYPNAEKMQVRIYIESMMRNTKVLDFLTGDQASRKQKA